MLRILRRSPTVRPSSQPIRVFFWNVAEVSQESVRRFASVRSPFAGVSSTIVCPGGAPTLLTTPAGLAILNGACTGGHVGDTSPFNVPGFPVTDSLSEKLDWFGTFRGRIGPTINPTAFAYLTGGLAYSEIRVTNNVSGTSLVGPQGVNGVTLVPGGGSLSNSTIKAGWTIGCGIETVISAIGRARSNISTSISEPSRDRSPRTS
jgi:hypothetical protein